jgi:hypothetical protein
MSSCRQGPDQNTWAIQPFGEALIESERQAFRHIAGDSGIDLSGKLNEPGYDPVLPCFPGKVERINRHAMAAEA